ncbi:MAG TPA: DUF1501 domain-containing protein [Gemmataceae bacterium]|nr:DUF1501 domain-containing protein [Gemmataceae bacterium]
MSRSHLQLTRREWLRLSAAGVLGASMSGWLENLAEATAASPERKRSCILLWMNGGPSQMDTFDLKPGHKNGGPYKEIATAAPGMKFSEHLPRLAKQAKHLAIVRSMSTKEGDHSQATYYLRTGYRAQGPIQYPPLGATLSKELGNARSALPNYVSIAPATFISPAAFTPGFLGPEHAPLIVGNQGFGFNNAANYEQALKVEDLQAPSEIKREQVDSRIELLQGLQNDFVAKHPGGPALSHQSAYERAVRLMRTAAGQAFELKDEPAKLRDRYGRNLFGQGCLLARRLVERGVPFVEVTLSNAPGVPINWDTHQQNFENVKKLSEVLDPAWATLLEDLEQRGLLDTTLVVWMGEFGRTPQINPQQGRDHFPNAWSTVLCGGGIRGGVVYGKTSPDGMEVKDNLVTVPNFLATVAKAVGVDPTKQNMSNVGRPIRIADAGSKPIEEVLS